MLLLGVTGMVVGVLNSYDRFGAFAIAVLLERRDHRRPGRAGPRVPGGGRDLRLRDRGPRRDGDPAPDPGLGPSQHAVRARRGHCSPRSPSTRRASATRRAAGAAADAPGDDQPRPDQLQPADQQHRRVPRLRSGAGRDRQGVPIYMLPQGIFSVAIATVLFPTLARFAARADLGRPALDDGERDAPDPAPAGPATAAILVLSEPMTRVIYERGEFDGADRPGLRGALLVRVLAAVQRPLPPADAHLLQPSAALGADRDLGRQPGADRRGGASRSTSRTGSAGSSPRPRSRRPRAWSPRPGPARRSWAARARGRLISSGDPLVSPPRSRGVAYGVWDVLDAALGARGGRADRLRREPSSARARSPTWRARPPAGPRGRAGAVARSRRASRDRPVSPDSHGWLSKRPRWAGGALADTQRHPSDGPHPQLLDHRPHRPREVDAGRPHPRADATITRRRCGPRCSTRWTSSASAGSRSRLRPCGSPTRPRTASPTTCT